MSERLIKRQDATRRKIKRIETRFEMYRTALAILIAMGLVLAVISLVSSNPLEAIRLLLIGPFTNIRQFGNVILTMIPILFTGLAITIVFKTNRFNLAVDGAFFLGMMVAVSIGIISPFSSLITIILALFSGAVVGAILGFIPAILNKVAKTSELVISLMQNYVVGHLVLYLFITLFRNKDSTALETYPMKKGVNLGVLFKFGRINIHYGLVIGLILVLIAYFVIYRTKWGYALRASGVNERFAKYAGINTATIVILTQVVGTALAGFGGAVEMLGRYTTFKLLKSPGYGFDGILLAILAKSNPIFIPVSAFFLAYIRIGADMVNFATDVPSEVIYLVQATIILLISAKSFLNTWKQRSVVKETISIAEASEEAK